MISMMCNLWDNFSMWVSDKWSTTTFALVVSIFGLLGLMALLSFFKKSFDKGKRPKWGTLILSLLMFALMAVVFAAKKFS